MSNIKSQAEQLFDAIETGKGAEGTVAFCHPGATFSCQAAALAEVTTVEGYAEWLKGLFTPIPDMHPEIKSLAADEERNNVTVFSVVHGTQSGEGGPVPPTGKVVAADYVYVFDFEGDRVRHMTKIWNDGFTMQPLGWA